MLLLNTANMISEDLKQIYLSLGDHNKKLEGKTILLLGGHGFLGSSIKKYLLFLNDEIFKTPCYIISVDNFIGKQIEIDKSRSDLLDLNCDITLPLNFIPYQKKIDFIINCSGHASPSGKAGYALNPIETMDTGYLGTKNVLNYALSCKSTLINFSSSEVLGFVNKEEIPTNELILPRFHTTGERACYDVIKAVIETVSFVYRFKMGLDVKVIRLFNCIGYFGQDDGRVIPSFFSKCLQNKKIEVFRPGSQQRTFSFFTDVIVGIFLVMLNGKDFLYHIGNDRDTISMFDLAQKIEQICNKKDLVSLIECPSVYLTEPQNRIPSIEKAKKELNYNPKVGLEDMLTRIYKWAAINYKY